MLGLQIDTKDILFICGGAFVELEKTIAERYEVFWSVDPQFIFNCSISTLHCFLLWMLVLCGTNFFRCMEGNFNRLMM